MNYVGIDVASKELSVVFGVNGKHRRAQSFENKAEDFKRLISLIQKLSGETIVCMEATGVHHFDLAVALIPNFPLKVSSNGKFGLIHRHSLLIIATFLRILQISERSN